MLPLKKRIGSSGFTLLELLISITLLGIFFTVFFSAFSSSIYDYFDLQTTTNDFSSLSVASQRIGNVIRGTTDFVSLNDNDVTLYAYFYPNDSNVSLIHYYINSQNNQVLADVTPMTANPPTGTPITAQKKTYIILNNYTNSSNVNLFTYLNDSGNVISTPVTNEHLVNGVTIKMAVPGSKTRQNGNQTIQITVSLRNRKTNL